MKRVRRLLKGSGGFTLIELIIVIAVMGFLVAMIVPRLAMITEEASDTACDTNQMRLRQVTANVQEKTGQLPNYLTNLINVIDDKDDDDPTNDIVRKPSVDDNDKDTGKEALSTDMDSLMHLCVHKLTDDEAEEIKGLGITKVFNLNLSDKVDPNYNEDGPATDDSASYMEEISVQGGVYVLMIGAGAPNGAHTWDTSNLDVGDKFGTPPDLIYRIVFGVGPDSSLVKDGQLQAAALCPNGMRRADHFIYNNYNIILPRLEATTERLSAETNTASVAMTAYDCLDVKGDGTDEVKLDIDLAEAQEIWQFSTFCPEGCQPGTAGITEEWEITAID